MLVNISFLAKPYKAFSSTIRDASCSKGWLRCVVETFFGCIIVISFVLIVLMALSNTGRGIITPSRCRESKCKVVCNETPFFDNYETDIIDAVWRADAQCDSIILILKNPYFINYTLPEKWLSAIRANVHELALIGGNIKHIPSHAFMSQFSSNIDTLILENIQITSWVPGTFVGLSSLKQLYIKDCKLINITRNALQAVGNTLELLDIKATSKWNPSYITGSADLMRLNVADFSLNPFYSTLGKSSFSSLQTCTALYLNSCKITSLGIGTFDFLHNIEILYLHNNYLTTVPAGLFANILPQKPRITLQDNYWHCDCSNDDLRTLHRNGLLIVDPICQYPEYLYGLSFSDFEGFCEIYTGNVNISSNDEIDETNNDYHNITNYIFINGACLGPRNNSDLQIITPHRQRSCHLNRMAADNVRDIKYRIGNSTARTNNWLVPNYSVQNSYQSMIEFSTVEKVGQGLLWYQTSCPSEVYCVGSIPQSLRLFDPKNIGTQYIFCPFELRTGVIHDQECVSYNFTDLKNTLIVLEYNSFYIYIILSLACSLFGAFLVFIIIHRNPSLLKGNKRILLVKHKEINALILPPEISPRNDATGVVEKENNKNKKIFLVSPPGKLADIERSMSLRSSDSCEVSYVSANQPTYEQLAHFRKYNYKKAEYNSLGSDIFSISSKFDSDSLTYYSLNEKIYETPNSLKNN